MLIKQRLLSVHLTETGSLSQVHIEHLYSGMYVNVLFQTRAGWFVKKIHLINNHHTEYLISDYVVYPPCSHGVIKIVWNLFHFVRRTAEENLILDSRWTLTFLIVILKIINSACWTPEVCLHSIIFDNVQCFSFNHQLSSSYWWSIFNFAF